MGHLLIPRARTAVVGKGIDADAATGSEQACHLDIFRIHKGDEVFHDLVHAVFVEVTVVAEGEEIEFETLS